MMISFKITLFVWFVSRHKKTTLLIMNVLFLILLVLLADIILTILASLYGLINGISVFGAETELKKDTILHHTTNLMMIIIMTTMIIIIKRMREDDVFCSASLCVCGGCVSLIARFFSSNLSVSLPLEKQLETARKRRERERERGTRIRRVVTRRRCARSIYLFFSLSFSLSDWEWKRHFKEHTTQLLL